MNIEEICAALSTYVNSPNPTMRETRAFCFALDRLNEIKSVDECSNDLILAKANSLIKSIEERLPDVQIKHAQMLNNLKTLNNALAESEQAIIDLSNKTKEAREQLSNIHRGLNMHFKANGFDAINTDDLKLELESDCIKIKSVHREIEQLLLQSDDMIRGLIVKMDDQSNFTRTQIASSPRPK